MRSRKPFVFPWFAGAMVFALVTMSTVQVVWLRSSVKMRQQIFDDNVQHSLNQISELLTRPSADMLQIDLEAISESKESDLVTSSSGMGSSLDNSETRMLNRVEALKIDSLVPVILTAHGIDIPVIVSIFDRYGQPVKLRSEDDEFRDALENTSYKAAIEALSLRIHFPKMNRYLLHEMLAQFALTGLMIAILAWGVFSAVTGAARNKRIDRIRRDLMNNLTHELKTPISTIGLASEALKDPDMQKDAESFSYYVGLIYEENKRLGLLVENVLQASLAESGKMQLHMQTLNLHDLLREVLKNVAIQVRKRGGKVDLELEADNALVYADRTHLSNVVFNLIDNALKYAEGELHLKITSLNTTDGVELRFQDNGIGIAKEHLGKVFDRLYRVPTGNVHDVKGFGLGLSYIKTVVDRHRGTIQVESEPRKGSTFILNLRREKPEK
jgi:two-component system phosphate regulon sensor histidine kinase PhoR